MHNYFVYTYILWAVVAVWVYNDAQKRKLKAAVAWAILTFLLGIFGIAGYYFWVIRPNKHDA